MPVIESQLSPCGIAALAHFDDGRSVVPLGEGKKPVGRDWANAWRDRDKLARYFASHPKANLGLVLGAIIDIEWDSPEQEQAFRKLFDGCAVPRTPCFRSSRGMHYFFLANERLAALGQAVISYKGLGIRIGSKAAQTMIPPSVNADGTRREWEVSFDDCEPAELP